MFSVGKRLVGVMQKQERYYDVKSLRRKNVFNRDRWEMRGAPVTSVAVRVERHHADSWTIRAVFTHKAVGVRPVWEVFGNQGNSDCDPLYVINGTLNLNERTGKEDERKKNSSHTHTQCFILTQEVLQNSDTF